MEPTDFELEIESLAWDGWGVGRSGGKVFFIPYTAPGDLIRCAVTDDRGRFAFGELTHLLRPSPDRIDPPCPVFGRCGSCQWQHVRYGRQLEAKRDILGDAITRIGRIDGVEVTAAVASRPDYGWRTVVDLVYEAAGAHPHVGFYPRHGSEIVPIEGCPVARGEINARIGHLSDALGALGIVGAGEIRLLAGTDDRVSAHLSVEGRGIGGRQVAERFLALAGVCGAEITTRSGTAAFGDPMVTYPGWDGSRELRLTCRPSGFVQANPGINRELIDRLISFDFTGKRVLELYSGIGNFSVPLAGAGARVTAVEAVPASVRDARRTAGAMGLDGITFIPGDVRSVLTGRRMKGAAFDVVVLDPPRNGARAVLERISELGASDILYVSCSPPTLARDLAVLTGRGWRLASVVPLDMFPQTFHVEALCHLTRE
jgi:23S rRNA (uracil1939-C5)-methyltransferase